MEGIEDIKFRARKIKHALLENSVTNEEEGQLFLDVVDLATTVAGYVNRGVASFAESHFDIRDGQVKIREEILSRDTSDFGKYFYERDGILYCVPDLVSHKGISCYGLGPGEPGSGGISTLGQLSNVGAWADELPGADRVLVQLNGATHWTSMALSAVVGLDTAALSKYLTDNRYAKLTDLPSLNGYATESWVSEHYLTGEGFDEKMSSWFKKDADGNIYCEASFYSTGEVAAYGAGEGGGSTGVSNLSELGDVGLSGLQNGNILQYDGTKWTNKVLSFPSGRWEDITGKPATFTPAEHTHPYLPLAGGMLTNQLIIETVDGGYFNEGIRINRNSNNWAGILLGALPGSTIRHDGAGWFIGTNPDRNFMINPTSSLYNIGLDLYRGGDVYWRGRQLAYVDEIAGIKVFASNTADRLTNKGIANEITSIDCNNLVGGGALYNYYSTAGWQNAPVGMNYGSVFQFNSGNTNSLAMQIAADVNHNNVESTRKLWFRTSNNLGFQNDWKEIWHSGNSNSLSKNWSCANLYVNEWIRSYGNVGWYSETYGGGIHMTDSTYVRVYNNKSFLVQGLIVANNYISGGSSVAAIILDKPGPYSFGIGPDGTSMRIRYGSVAGISTPTWVGVALEHYFDGNIVATGEVTAYSASDVRLKENVCSLDGLSYLRRLNFYEFDWNGKARELTKDDRRHGFGGLAHEFQDVLPDLVGNIYNSEYLGIRYEKLIPHLGAAILQMDRVQGEHERRIARIEQNLNIE